MSVFDTARSIGKTQQAAKPWPNAPLNEMPAASRKFVALSAPRMTPTAIPKLILTCETCGARYSTSAKQKAKNSDERNKDMTRDFVLPLASANRERVMSITIAGIAGRIYPGSFDFEIEKKMRQKAAHVKKKRDLGDRYLKRVNCTAPATKDHTARAVQGSRAINRTAP